VTTNRTTRTSSLSIPSMRFLPELPAVDHGEYIERYLVARRFSHSLSGL
jgi:hypothetical protein